MSLPLCVDCRYFATLDDETRAADLPQEKRKDYLQGHCRRNPPSVGTYRGEEEYLEYDYGQWAVVLSADWCGAFEPCQRTDRGEASLDGKGQDK